MLLRKSAAKRTMKAVDRISPKFMSCAAACRGFVKPGNILGVCLIASRALRKVLL